MCIRDSVTVRASKGRYGGANALFTYQDDIVVKNGSTVDAFAEGEVSAAFSTRKDVYKRQPRNTGTG